MWTFIGAPFGFSLLAIVAALIGALALAIRPEWVRKHAAFFSTVAAGVLLVFVLMDLMPHALESGPLAPGLVVGGFMAGAVVALLTGHHHRGACSTPHFERALVPLLGISLHALLDGVVFAVNHAEGPRAAILAAAALGLHKVPVAALTFGLMRTAGLNTVTSLLLTVGSVGVMSAIGAIGSEPIVMLLGSAGISALFAISAGLLLYVACGPLLSASVDLPRARAAGAITGGAALALAVLVALPHDHAHADHEGDLVVSRDHRPGFLAPYHDHDDHEGHDH